MAGQDITREQLAQLLNEDLSREYQAIIAYVVYSQVLKGAEYMNIAAQTAAQAQRLMPTIRERQTAACDQGGEIDARRPGSRSPSMAG